MTTLPCDTSLAAMGHDAPVTEAKLAASTSTSPAGSKQSRPASPHLRDGKQKSESKLGTDALNWKTVKCLFSRKGQTT